MTGSIRIDLAARELIARALFVKDQSRRGLSTTWELATPKVRNFHRADATQILVELDKSNFQIIKKPSSPNHNSPETTQP